MTPHIRSYTTGTASTRGFNKGPKPSWPPCSMWLTRGMSTFRHILMIRFRPEATEEQKQALYRGLGSMPAKIDLIRRYELGPDLGLIEGNPDMALVADFDSEEDWRAYQAHPEHQVLSRELVKPITAEMIRVQYLVE